MSIISAAHSLNFLDFCMSNIQYISSLWISISKRTTTVYRPFVIRVQELQLHSSEDVAESPYLQKTDIQDVMRNNPLPTSLKTAIVVCMRIVQLLLAPKPWY